MRYLGGKSRSAGHIAEIILRTTTRRQRLVSPFLGGAAVETRLARHFDSSYLTDIVPDLILMWEAATHGWTPGEISEAQYQKLRHQAPSAERGFAGFGASFGGKWFAGYDRIGPVQALRNGGATNASIQSARTVARDAKQLINCRFQCRDYRDVVMRPDDVVYADPPYGGTTEYEACNPFGTAQFWRVAQEWVEQGAHVYISQNEAPEGWTAAWEGIVPGSLDAKTKRRERLWRHASQVEPLYSAPAGRSVQLNVTQAAN